MNWKMWIMIAVALVVLPLAACSGVSATVHFRADDAYNYLTIDMTEQEAQTLFAGLLEESNDLHISNPVVDLRAGEISISGEVPSGNGATVPATLVISASMENGQPSLVVTSASFAGWEGTPDMLQGINGDLLAGLSESAQNPGGQLTEISITDTSLSFTVRGPREQ
ncbi:MAG: hypothetical protein ABI835_09900 [Chloroflexota bacterium]